MRTVSGRGRDEKSATHSNYSDPRTTCLTCEKGTPSVRPGVLPFEKMTNRFHFNIIKIEAATATLRAGYGGYPQLKTANVAELLLTQSKAEARSKSLVLRMNPESTMVVRKVHILLRKIPEERQREILRRYSERLL